MPHADPEVRRAYGREWQRQSRSKPLALRESQLKYRFKMTLDDFDRLLDEQGGACAICRQPPAAGKNLAVDHDHGCCPGKHSCGKCVRGLLCSFCNTGIGCLRESPEFLTRAIAYLEEPAGVSR